jgi:hypothetical protein
LVPLPGLEVGGTTARALAGAARLARRPRAPDATSHFALARTKSVLAT